MTGEVGGNPTIRQQGFQRGGTIDLGGVRGVVRPKAILVVTDGYTGWPPEPVGPRVVACLTQAGTADNVPKWIDSVVLNPAN